MTESFLNGKVTLRTGNCAEVVEAMPDNFVDSVITDPPYALVSIAKRFGKPGSAPAKDVYGRGAAGFMGKVWDTGDVAFDPAFWAEVLRVTKPGGHVVAFSGTRTYHRLACAIEDAGWEIRDQIAWTYGSGFPKSHNAGDGWGTALKPAWEPICVARKPLIGTVAANVLQHGTGAINVDGCRVAGEARPNIVADYKDTDNSTYEGRMDGSLAGGSKADGKTELGRWPANLIHDGSPEVLAAFPDTGASSGRPRNNGEFKSVAKGAETAHTTFGHDDDGGSAARFFYTAKADADDRLGFKHPTIKPVDLMQWLVRLVTPKGGHVPDPFAGTGTTGEAAWREGMRCVLIEREPEYQDYIRRRMHLAERPAERTATVKAKGIVETAGPLFGDVT